MSASTMFSLLIRLSANLFLHFLEHLFEHVTWLGCNVLNSIPHIEHAAVRILSWRSFSFLFAVASRFFWHISLFNSNHSSMVKWFCRSLVLSLHALLQYTALDDMPLMSLSHCLHVFTYSSFLSLYKWPNSCYAEGFYFPALEAPLALLKTFCQISVCCTSNGQVAGSPWQMDAHL